MSEDVPTLDDDAVRLAARLSPGDLALLFRTMAPMIRRMARGLCGEESAGDTVVAAVLDRSVAAIERFSSVAQARNWFSHHTVLTSRRIVSKQVTPRDDVLAHGGDAGMVAFIAAVRHLPFQQREAFILTHGQQYDARQMAIAMDCSTTAAANHLLAATASLRALDAQHFTNHVSQLALNFASFRIVEETAIPVVLSKVKRRKIGRWLWRIFLWLFVAVLAYVVWRIAPMITI